MNSVLGNSVLLVKVSLVDTTVLTSLLLGILPFFFSYMKSPIPKTQNFGSEVFSFIKSSFWGYSFEVPEPTLFLL